MRQPTIHDVARAAGVSVASVSRALNGHANVRVDMRERVREAVDQLGYTPNAAARSLSMALTQTIGVVVPDLHGEFFSELIRGMDGAAGSDGYQLLLSTMHADVALAGQALRAMRGRVDGLIVMAPQMTPAELDALLPVGLPTVLAICAPGGNRPMFGIDNRGGAAAAAQHLVGLGRRKIVHIMGPDRNIDARARRDSFVAELHRAAPDAVLKLMPGDFHEDSGAAAVRTLIQGGEAFDAIFAANDLMALGALLECRALGLDVPGDVAIVGFDDVPLARFMGLTTMRVHVADIGARAVDALVTMIRAPDEMQSGAELTPELVIRQSSSA